MAAGWSPVDALVKDCMTEDVAYAYCDEATEEVLERMKVLQIRRLVVLDRDKNLAGIVALGDIATEPDAAAEARVGAAMAEISEPSRPLK
ncbi:CBS domain-containing protein [Reyranella sp.]|uniref:CBS domain-containing protein n=1 Tax=Reyranella sp. TaxID=1929291 RepID=UPI003C7D4ABD